MLQAQRSRELGLWQTRHEIAEKSSKIVPLGAPLFPLKNPLRTVAKNARQAFIQCMVILFLFTFFAATELIARGGHREAVHSQHFS